MNEEDYPQIYTESFRPGGETCPKGMRPIICVNRRESAVKTLCELGVLVRYALLKSFC